MAACTATNDYNGDPSLFSYFLTASDNETILGCTMLLMLTANRVSHCNLAIQQARNVAKLLQSIPADNVALLESTKKELLSLGDTLAVTLTTKRHYVTEKSPGLFELDPRFLLFEFCHGLVLRESQVHLVRKLLGEMKGNKSVCHQVMFLLQKYFSVLMILLR